MTTTSILNNYPEWLAEVEQAASKPPVPINYKPGIWEYHDQHGLLVGSFFGQVYETQRKADETSDFLALYFITKDNSEMVFFSADNRVLVNRLKGFILTSSYKEVKK